MQKLKNNAHLVVIIGILFTTGIVFSHAFTKTRLLTTTVLADEEESGSGERDSESSNKERDDDERNSVDSRDESDHEDGDKEDSEDSAETRRFGTITQGTTLRQEDDENDNEVDENDTEDGDENDSQEGIQELNKDITKVESKINVLGANGVSVDSFRTTLAEIKDLASQAGAELATAPKEAETLIETADHKLERLSKLVKMMLGDEDENDDDNDAVEEIQDLAKDVAKLEIRLNALSASGADVSAMTLSLNNVKDLLSQAKDKVTAGDLAGAEALTEVADKKMETLKHAMELAYGDDEEDGDEADKYKNEVALFVHNLKEIGDIEGGIGKQVRVVAQAQNNSAAEIENSIKGVEDRGAVTEFFIGPDYESIAEIKTAIVGNETRIKVLTDLANQITDPAVKQVLQDQIKMLAQQNANLQKFVAENESGFSLFGWLVKIFA